MRLWSLHPRHLDRQGLTACWREALLAQAVLAGRTRGYTRHPQLDRFRDAGRDGSLIAAYLAGVADEADARGYRFDRERIDAACPASGSGLIAVTDRQLAWEWEHLLAKLSARSPEVAERWKDATPQPHPLFHVVPGPIEAWERAAGEADQTTRG